MTNDSVFRLNRTIDLLRRIQGSVFIQFSGVPIILNTPRPKGKQLHFVWDSVFRFVGGRELNFVPVRVCRISRQGCKQARSGLRCKPGTPVKPAGSCSCAPSSRTHTHTHTRAGVWLSPLQGDSGGFDSQVCPRMVGSEKH